MYFRLSLALTSFGASGFDVLVDLAPLAAVGLFDLHDFSGFAATGFVDFPGFGEGFLFVFIASSFYKGTSIIQGVKMLGMHPLSVQY
jgi:hypothetical protein